MDWRKRVTKEKSLSEVYWKARRIGSTRGNFVIPVVVVILFGILATFDHYLALEILPLSALKGLLGQVADIGFTLTTAILGFLIAGFSIFASITRPEIFAGLAKLDHNETGLSRLQFIFFNFLLVFIHYLAFLGASIVLRLGLPLAPALLNATSLSTVPWAIYVWWSSVVLAALLLGWLAFLIMLLKSFIWNIYQAVLVVIVTGDMISDLEKKASASVDTKS